MKLLEKEPTVNRCQRKAFYRQRIPEFSCASKDQQALK